MSSFTKRVKKEFKFENDVVLVISERLKKEDFAELSPLLVAKENGEFSLDMQDVGKFLDVASEIMQRRVQTFEGLRNDEGEPVALSDCTSELYFMELTSEVLAWIIGESFASKEKK